MFPMPNTGAARGAAIRGNQELWHSDYDRLCVSITLLEERVALSAVWVRDHGRYREQAWC